MMRTAACLAVLVALAGCSSDSGGGDGETTTPSTSTTPPPPPPPMTDTLHLGMVPAMTTAVPEGTTDISTPVPASGFGGGGGGGGGMGPPDAEWIYTLGQDQTVTGGEIHIWIEITETLVQPVNPFPGSQNCSWFVNLDVGISNSPDIACIAEPLGPINPVVKELVFEFTTDGAITVGGNETITLQFGRTPFSLSQNTPVNVLSGSKDHDSFVTLTGLNEILIDA